MNVENYGIKYMRDYGALAAEAPKDVPKGQSKEMEALTLGSAPTNSIGETVSAEVENDITHDDDVSKEFAEYKYPVPTLRVEEMSAHGL